MLFIETCLHKANIYLSVLSKFAIHLCCYLLFFMSIVEFSKRKYCNVSHRPVNVPFLQGSVTLIVAAGMHQASTGPWGSSRTLKKAKGMSNPKSPFLHLVPGAAAWHLPAKAKLRCNVTKKDQSFPDPKTTKRFPS